MSIKIFFHISDDKSCTVYRALMPVLHLYNDLSLNGIHVTADLKTLPAENFDIFIFNRLIRPNFYNEIVIPWLQLGKSFVWQCDDDLWQIPKWNPAGRLLTEEDLDTTNKYIEIAKSLWVSTDNLKSFVACSDKTKVLPNLIDLNQFDDKIDRPKMGPIKILWCGSASHDRDFNDVVDAVNKLAEKYGHKIAFIFWGYLPTELAYFEREPGFPYANLIPKRDNVFYGEWFSHREYFYKLRHFKPDIAIMPLDDCPFNYSKSNLKYLEMSMAGAACVATDLPPYNCIVDKETALLVKPKDTQGWIDAIDELITNQEFRLKLNANACEQIRSKFAWQSPSRQLWLDAFLSLVQ